MLQWRRDCLLKHEIRGAKREEKELRGQNQKAQPTQRLLLLFRHEYTIEIDSSFFKIFSYTTL